ncbi:unnamed protein product [Trichobilharzia szidati]|nr:unnamed protein product [Trichobilharzia szidati]
MIYSRAGWAHIVCAIYVPEVYFTDFSIMELISVENVPAERFGRSCVFCERNQRNSLATCGACIQCAWKNCRVYFHASCAGLEGLLSELPATEASGSLSIADILFGATGKNKVSLQSSNDITESCKDMNQIFEQESSKFQLNGFCCVQHKKKFYEVSNSNSTPAISHSDTTSKLCKSPMHDEPPGEVTNQSIRRRSSQLRLTQRSQSSDPDRIDDKETFQDVIKDGKKSSSPSGGGQNSSKSQKDQYPDGICSPESTSSDCSNPKRVKMDECGGETVQSEQVPAKAMEKVENTDPKMHESPVVMNQADNISSLPVNQEKAVEDNLLCPLGPLSDVSTNDHGDKVCDKNTADYYNTTSPPNPPSVTTLEFCKQPPQPIIVSSPMPTTISSSSSDVTYAAAQLTEKQPPRVNQQNTVRRRKRSNKNTTPQSTSSTTTVPNNHLAVTADGSSGTVVALSQNSTTSLFTQDNLPLVIPRRPLSLRGLGISCNSRNSSILNNTASSYIDSPGTMYTNGIPISSKGDNPPSLPPTLSTMHDLLEWQWDQAGSLLMQQAKNTDVVTLLDCLHQLKCENDILEAKLVRLTTRHEHLRSVNARLSNSLATMEATMVINSPKHEISEQNSSGISNLSKKTNNHSSQLLDTNIVAQDSHLSSVLHAGVDRESQQNQLTESLTKGYSRHPVTVSNNTDQLMAAKFSHTVNKKVPILPKDPTTTGLTTGGGGGMKRNSTSLTDNLNSFDKLPSTPSASSSASLLTQNQPPVVFCISPDLSKSTHDHSQPIYSSLIKHQPQILPNDLSTTNTTTIQHTNQPSANLGFVPNSCAVVLPNTAGSAYFTKTVDLNDLQEISARLSSAIAARQPQPPKTSNNSTTPQPCPVLPKNAHSGKRNTKTVHSQPTSSSSSSKLPLLAQASMSSPVTTTSMPKVDTGTTSNSQNYCLANLINTQPSLAVDFNKTPYHTDPNTLQLQKNSLENYAIVVSNNRTASNQFNNCEPTVTVTTNNNATNSLNLSSSSSS